jgi:hypothetical protein
MLKKLVPILALTSLAFGSGLCFDPYNHDYGVSTEKIPDDYLSGYNKTIILHNGKMQVDKDTTIELVRYMTEGNKVLVLMRGKGSNTYFVVYTECTHGKPVTKDVEAIGFSSSTERVVDLPKYPIKLGFYKDGFWVKALEINWIRHMDQDRGPGGYACDYETDYYPYKLIKEHKTGDAPFKDEELPTKLCQALGNKYGP